MGARIAADDIRVKRAYERRTAADGTRILVDRLWPRGLSRKAAAIDRWAKEIAPSTALRKWFAHDPARWREFQRRYAAELRRHSDALRMLRAQARRGPVTLVYSARDEVHNDAVVLRNVLLGRSPA
ncbi:MAG: hypothetical protein K0S54_2466 [Alphaproteobacteria bacterium]|jgi:uncharacterized protein YeaO (DUF488 family)|nr:hypothetical protein [Alphaproteobacteria bacterium]